MKTSSFGRRLESDRAARRAGRSSRRRPLVLEALEGRVVMSLTPQMVLDIFPGAPTSYPAEVVAIGSTAYFTADDGVHGQELWKSDGTAAGTTLVKDIYPGGTLLDFYGYTPNNGSPRSLENVNGVLFFRARDGVHGEELWKSDGTAEGTLMVSDIVPGGSPSYPDGLTNVNGTLFFTAAEGEHGRELWKSDGTAAGTTLVKDIYPGTSRTGDSYYGYFDVINSGSPRSLTNVNGTLFFTAEDGVNGGELWKSDGTAAGTTIVKDINPGLSGANPYGLTNVGGTLFFSADDGAYGRELWKSDGTAAGTTMVKDINPGLSGANPSGLTNVGGTLFFSADGGVYGRELWQSDGTAAGTTMVGDINPGMSHSYPQGLTDVNGRLFFTADDGAYGHEVWTLAEGTTRVVTPAVSGFPATITAGVSGGFTVTARNADGTTDAGFRGIVRFSSSDPQAVLPADYTFTAADAGTRTFAATLKTAGGQSITATVLGSDGGTATQSGIAVNPAAASRFSVAGFPTPATAGVAGTLTVTALDPYGDRATGYQGTVRLGSSDATAALPGNYAFTAADAGMHTFAATLKKAGTQSLTATDTVSAAIVGTQTGIQVNPAAASRLVLGAPASVKVKSQFNLTVTVVDAYGNVVADFRGTLAFASSDPTASLPGSYTFTAADGGVHTFTRLVLKKRGRQTIKVTDTRNGSLTDSAIIDVL